MAKHRFPDTILVVDEEEDRKGKPRLYIIREDFKPLPNEPRIQATYKLVGVERVTSQLVVERETIKKRQ